MTKKVWNNWGKKDRTLGKWGVSKKRGKHARKAIVLFSSLGERDQRSSLPKNHFVQKAKNAGVFAKNAV